MRERAAFYRTLAKEEADPEKQAILLEMAELLETGAGGEEAGTDPAQS